MRRVVALVAVISLLGACSSSASPSPQGASPTPAAAATAPPAATATPAVATAAATPSPATATQSPAAPSAAPSTPGALTNTRVAGTDVDSTTIPQLEALMDAHRLTSEQLVQFYLDRIAQLNPALHAVITVAPTALTQARAADASRGAAHTRRSSGSR